MATSTDTKKWFTTLQILCRFVAIAEIGRIYNTWDKLAKQWKMPEGIFANCEFTEVWICTRKKTSGKIEFTAERAYTLEWLINTAADEIQKWEHFHALAAKLAEELETKQIRCSYKGMATELAKEPAHQHSNKKYKHTVSTTGRYFELTGSHVNGEGKTLSLQDDFIPALEKWLMQNLWKKLQLELSLVRDEWNIACYITGESRKVVAQSASLKLHLQEALGLVEPIQITQVLTSLTQIQ